MDRHEPRHEWTDEGETWEIDRAKAPSGAHLTLRYAPSLHTLAREILRLAEEVERLKDRIVLLTDEESQWQAKKVIEAAERARIRRGLLDIITDWEEAGRDGWMAGEPSPRQVLAAAADLKILLDHICPEEG